MILRLTTIFTLFTVLSGFNASAQSNEQFKEWDDDNDGLIERYEFTSQFIDEYFKAWDPADRNGIIEEGFFHNSYAGLDSDNDNYLSDQEWLIGYNYFYDQYLVSEDMAVVDINEDGKVTYDEYYDALYDTHYFTDIDLDSDNYISEYELANFVFDNWDFNNTGTISRSEFNKFDWYYLDV